MSSGTVELASPNIFDRLLGYSGVPLRQPPKPRTDETHRFYVCEKLDKTKATYTCQRGTLEEVCAEQVKRQRLQPGHILRTGVHVMSVAAGCPSWNDRLVLAQKFLRPVAMGPPLAAPQA